MELPKSRAYGTWVNTTTLGRRYILLVFRPVPLVIESESSLETIGCPVNFGQPPN